MTTIAYRDSAANSISGAATNKVIVIPATAQSGDFMILGVSMTATGGGHFPAAPPTGWTQIRTGTSNNDGGAAYWRTANASDAGSTVLVEAGGGGATKASMTIGVYYNTDSTAPIDVSGITLETTTTASHSATSLTVPSGHTDWLIRMLFIRDGSTGSTSYITPSGTTQRAVAQSAGPTGGANAVIAVLADTNGDKAAGTYTGTWTVDQTSNSAVMIDVAVAGISSTTTIRPSSDVTTTGFTTVPSGLALWQVLADDDPTTYTVSPTGGGTEQVKYDPAPVLPATLEVSGLVGSGTSTQSVTVSLYAGGSLVHAWAAETTLQTSEHKYTYDLTALTTGEKAVLSAGLTDIEVRVVSATT